VPSKAGKKKKAKIIPFYNGGGERRTSPPQTEKRGEGDPALLMKRKTPKPIYLVRERWKKRWVAITIQRAENCKR